ncbi:MAG: hypothetical protein HQL57_07375 [Magnetococcales bacterium]|nr:hypothetical protein [Magnetococcales bacterium]MBF0156988.1 hypothetical protein [Magnetococcales bacterium]
MTQKATLAQLKMAMEESEQPTPATESGGGHTTAPGGEPPPPCLTRLEVMEGRMQDLEKRLATLETRVGNMDQDVAVLRPGLPSPTAIMTPQEMAMRLWLAPVLFFGTIMDRSRNGGNES